MKKEDNIEVEDESDSDPFAKDKFEMIKSLRKVILSKYKVLEVIGKGSYGCVSKA